MYVTIEGVIGVGKTTLARLLQPKFSANLLLEVFEENPFLSRFYADRSHYAFQTQLFFLLSRFQQQHRNVPSLLNEGKPLFTDYLFEKDTLFARANLQGDELDMYYRVHEALSTQIPSPDLIVYLRARTETLMQRIALRDRSYERNIETAYIEQLRIAYDHLFLHWQRPTPVLILDADQLDFVRNPQDLEWVENRIRQTLCLPPFQPELPLLAGVPAS